MLFDVPSIVKQVSESVMQKVDTRPEDFADRDFTDIGTQDALVNEEIQEVFEHMPDRTYDQLVENILNHPEMQLCFETAKVVVDDWKHGVVQAERERQSLIRDYYREVL